MRLFHLFSRYFLDRRANVLPIFALSVIPIFGLIGAAFDFSRANSVKASMQAALDATGLMLSKEATTLTTQQLVQKANDYFLSQFNRPEASHVQITPVLTDLSSGAKQLDISGSAIVGSTFTRVFMQPDINVNTTSQVIWGYRKLELALALDNTGSMASSNKLTELKTAVHNLLDTLQAAERNPGDIKVSIIPFEATVRLSTSYKNESWFDWSTLDCNGSNWGTGCGSNPQNMWEGCVMDRNQSYDVQDDAPTTSSRKFPTTQCGSLATSMPLTYNWTALHNKVNAMVANGATNVTIGLAWAWHSLTPGVPFSEGSDTNPDVEKVIIALTDGENTMNRWWGNGYNTDSRIDARTQLACDNAKATGIKIYTIRVIEGNANLLRNCASNSSMYYDVQQASQLNAVFGQIAEKLANLRISR